MSAQEVYRATGPARRQSAPQVGTTNTAGTCPVCVEGAFRVIWLASTVLLICDHGCPGRRVAAELGLADWPERVR